MDDKNYFSGALQYFLIEEEESFLLENGLNGDPFAKKRIEFREKFLNEMVLRVGECHLSIQMNMEIITDHKQEKHEYFIGRVGCLERMIQKIIEHDLLEMAELAEQISILLKGKILGSYGELFQQKNRKNLKKRFNDDFLYEQHLAFIFLFPFSQLVCFNNIYDELICISKKLKSFRDKVIAHKFDQKRF